MAERPGLAIVIHSGDFARVHYALVLASAAAAIDRTVCLFFTMDACRGLQPPEDLKSWAALEANFANKGLATFEEMLTACAELEVAITVCEMGLKAIGMAPSDLRTDIPISITGAVTFLNASGAETQMLFV